MAHDIKFGEFRGGKTVLFVARDYDDDLIYFDEPNSSEVSFASERYVDNLRDAVLVDPGPNGVPYKVERGEHGGFYVTADNGMRQFVSDGAFAFYAPQHLSILAFLQEEKPTPTLEEDLNLLSVSVSDDPAFKAAQDRLKSALASKKITIS